MDPKIMASEFEGKTTFNILINSLKAVTTVKEKEIEIGSPTDVKHVAHIGWDDPNGNGPTWMNEFKTAPDFSTSIGANPNSTNNQDFENPTGSNQGNIPTAGVTNNVPKKPKRKKGKSTTSSPKSSSKQSRAPRSKGMLSDTEATTIADQH